MLLANNLSFSRNNVNVFKDINLSIGSGQIKQIKGKNGSGKTTFLKTILNILLPENGEVFWEGKNIKKNIFNFYKEITLIMDEPSSTKSLTLINNINFWRGFSNSIITKNEVSLLLKAFNLEKYKDTQVMYLSSGEVKKLELLRLIIEQKKIWILDEPYNHLDELTIEILNQTFVDHVNNDGIVLFASHYRPSINKLDIIDFT